MTLTSISSNSQTALILTSRRSLYDSGTRQRVHQPVKLKKIIITAKQSPSRNSILDQKTDQVVMFLHLNYSHCQPLHCDFYIIMCQERGCSQQESLAMAFGPDARTRCGQVFFRSSTRRYCTVTHALTITLLYMNTNRSAVKLRACKCN